MKRIMIVAGEASGDLHAAGLVKSLKLIDPHLQFFGLGSKKMQEAGVKVIYDMSRLAIVGFFEILNHLGTFKALFEKLKKMLETKKVDAVILVDYPGFNLRLAKVAKEKNIPVIYYISPQIWAWGKDRIDLIKRYVDKMIVIFGFEEDIYKEVGVKVNFVGHPFLDIVRPEWKKEDAIWHLKLNHHSTKIALLPGSREKEVTTHLPIILKACEIIKKSIPDAEFILSKRKELDPQLYNRILQRSRIKVHFLENRPYDILNVSDIAIVSSGSATLETAIIGRPMVIIYKTSILTWLFARRLIRISNIGLVNIVAGKRIVPELVQFEVTPKNIAEELMRILKDKKLYHHIKEGLERVKSKLGEPGATRRAAHTIYNFIVNKTY